MNTNYDTGHRSSVEEFPSYFSAGYSENSFSSNHVNYRPDYHQNQYGQGLSLPQDSSQYSNGKLLDSSGNFNLPDLDFSRDSGPSNGFNTQELQRFTTSRDAGPWTGVQPNHRGNQPPNPHTSSPSHVFKRPAIPARRSNNGSLDSGIGSLNGINVVGSQNDHNSKQFGDDASGHPQNANADPNAQATTQGRKRKSKYEATLCPDCPDDKPKWLKNKSEAQKHSLQHSKPFTCEMEGCPRHITGFATENDLQRHRKSVHQLKPSVGKETGYICQGCPPPGPGVTPKFWPRLDNFKAHIRRRHTDWPDQAVLIQMSEGERPPDAVSESGYASQYQQSVPPEEQAYQYEIVSPGAPPMSRNGSCQDGMALFGLGDQHQFDQLAGIGEGQHADRNLGNREPDLGLHGTSSGSIRNGATALPNPPHQLVSPADSALTSPSISSHGNPSIFLSQHDYHGRAHSFSDVQYYNPPSKRQKTIDNRNSHNDLANYRNEKGEWECPDCPKTKRLECELRKHMKRHSRPYGCTFANCSKRFGSRNDWKRHENTQHFLQEMWRCEFNGPDGDKCGKLAFHINTFSNHLQRKHGIPLKSSENEARCKSMHLGREGHDHFWCGFCNSLIEQNDTMEQGAYDLRFRHIGFHFDKEGKWIDDWIDIEENRKKGLIAKEGRKKNRARYRNGGADEDSDLGDDGIPPFVTGYSASASHASVGYGPGMPAQANLYTSNKDGMRDTDLDADAVSDSEWR